MTNLPVCHSERSAAKSRNLAGNCTSFSVRIQIPPLRDAAHHSGRNDIRGRCGSEKDYSDNSMGYILKGRNRILY